MVMATFKNISAITWASVLLVEEKGVPGENHRPAATHWQDWIRNLCRGLRICNTSFRPVVSEDFLRSLSFGVVDETLCIMGKHFSSKVLNNNQQSFFFIYFLKNYKNN
jgi:hypothetical protein